MTLILASKSAARQAMFKNAGLVFEAYPADLDERGIIEAHKDSYGDNDSNYAAVLAAAKSKDVSAQFPDNLVIGSDQILECDGQILSKAADKNEAREKLKFLRGKTHKLISAAAVSLGGKVIWEYSDSVKLSMHDFDGGFLDSYIDNAGDALTSCVGAYEFEGLGAQLFEKIEGDYFTILGMPLLPLLNYLRTEHGVGL